MNTLIVYFSKYGHTQMVAESIGKAIAAHGLVRLLDSEQLQGSDLEDIALVVMGCPTHKMNLPEAVRPVFKRLPKRALRGKVFAAFDTSYKMSPLLARFTASKKLAQRLRKLGGRRLVQPETFHVAGREGPLYEGELERAGAWAKVILARLDGQGAGRP